MLASSENEIANREAQQKIVDKYSSLDHLQKADKINALKDVNLNPYRLANPYDGLANSLHRWKTVANDAVLSNYTEEQKSKVAEHYYDKMIAPMYGGMGIAPMNKELWMKQAFKEATNYNIEDSYNSSITHSIKHGWDSGLAATARGYGFLSDMIGNGIDDAVALWRKGTQNMQHPTVETRAEDAKPWFEQAKDLHNFISSIPHQPSAISRGAKIQGENHQFWADALPTHDGWINHATSGIVEQAAQLPVYAAMAMGEEGIEAAGGASLTARLSTSPVGKRVLGYLMAGTEGLAYGVATRPQEDKGQAWRDAAGFAIFHGIFDVAGLGAKKLIDVVGGDLKGPVERRAETLELAQQGKRRLTPVETYDLHKVEVANNLAVGGIPAQRAIYAEALDHIAKTETGFDRKSIKAYELGLLRKDPARYAPVLSASKYIRSVLGATGKRLSEIEPGSEDEKYLSSRLAQLIVDAGSEMNTAVKGFEEESHIKATEDLAKPEAKHTLEFYIAKTTASIAKQDPAALKMMKPEQIKAIAQKAYEKDLTKAAQESEKQLNANPIEEATNIAKRNKPSKTTAKPVLKIRSERTEDRFGQPSARYNIVSDYKVRLQQHVKNAKIQEKSLTDYFKDLDDEDFVSDLSNHFYPKALKDAGIWFENQKTREGAQNPNFLGFMHNYIKQMPKEFGQALEERLVDSMKVQKYMNGRKPSEPQLEYFAKAMYNHVDNFLGSGRWPAETNIFRSSNEDMFNSTRWQRQLLKEKQVQEQNNLKDMFSGNPTALRAAMKTYKTLKDARIDQYTTGPKDLKSQHKISEIDTSISDLITQTSQYERIPF